MPPITLRLLAARGAAWKLGSDVLGRLMQYVLLWAAARTLAPADFGDFTFALSIGFMVAQVADFGLQLFVQRELSRLAVQGATSPPYFTSTESAGRLLGGALVIKAVLSCVALAAFALLVAGYMILRALGIEPVHTRIVRGPEVDQDTVVGGRGNVTQHLSELASGEFARSTCAADHFGQPLLFAKDAHVPRRGHGGKGGHGFNSEPRSNGDRTEICTPCVSVPPLLRVLRPCPP